jgi:hypothetical protein
MQKILPTRRISTSNYVEYQLVNMLLMHDDDDDNNNNNNNITSHTLKQVK